MPIIILYSYFFKEVSTKCHVADIMPVFMCIVLATSCTLLTQNTHCKYSMKKEKPF